MIFRKFQEKEETSKKAGEHQKREELFSGTGKTGRTSGKSGEAKEKSGVSFTTPEKGEELQKKPVNTGRRRSSGTTPRKCGALPEKLVKSEKTPEKDGETPGKSGEPVFLFLAEKRKKRRKLNCRSGRQLPPPLFILFIPFFLLFSAFSSGARCRASGDLRSLLFAGRIFTRILLLFLFLAGRIVIIESS